MAALIHTLVVVALDCLAVLESGDLQLSELDEAQRQLGNLLVFQQIISGPTRQTAPVRERIDDGSITGI